MRILLTGATGLVGTELVAVLHHNNIDVHYLTTSQQKIIQKPNYKGFYWDPEKGTIDESALLGVDAIINLAGASIASRWTNSYKQQIIESRIFSANLLYNTLKNNPHQVRQIVSASAIGIYPDSLTAKYTEESIVRPNDFLGKVVEKWEAGVDKFSRIGIKVCKLRTGLVLSDKGGALPVMAKPIQIGAGAAFGSGDQIQSWIHLSDLAQMYYFAVQNQLEGTYNAVAPNPVSNKQLTKAIAKLYDKKLILPNIPRFVMKIALGEMHELLFKGQFVSSQKISDAGFKFGFPELQAALHNLINEKSFA